MRRYFTILLFVLLVPRAWSQTDTHIVDSLLDVLSSQQGRERVLTMMELTWEFYDISFDESTTWGEKAIAEAQAMDSTNLVAKANYVLGMQYCFHGDLDLAKGYLNKSCQLYRDLGNLERLFNSQWQKARYEQAKGNVDSSFAYYESALVTAQKMHDTVAYTDVQYNMAVILYEKGELNRSKAEYLRLRDYYIQKNDDFYLPMVNLNLAAIEMELGNASVARSSFYSLIPDFEANSDNTNLMYLYKNLGTIYLDDFINYDSALICLQTARRYSEVAEYTYFASDVVNELGNAYFKLEDYDASMRCYEEALVEAEKIQYHGGMAAAFAGMGQVYYKLGKAQKSLDCYQKCFEMESKMGNEKYRTKLGGELVRDYARLGRFDDMEAELSVIEDNRKALIRENADLFDENLRLQAEVEDLCSDNQSQSNQIDILTTRAKHYQLAFFGLLGLVLVALLFVILKKLKR